MIALAISSVLLTLFAIIRRIRAAVLGETLSRLFPAQVTTTSKEL